LDIGVLEPTGKLCRIEKWCTELSSVSRHVVWCGSFRRTNCLHPNPNMEAKCASETLVVAMGRCGTRCHKLEDKIRTLTAGIAWSFTRKHLNTRIQTRSRRYLVVTLPTEPCNLCVCVCVCARARLCVCVCQYWRRFQLKSRLLFHELYNQHVPVPRLFRPAIRLESVSVCTWITSTSFNLRRFVTTNICLMKHWNLRGLTRPYLQIIFMFEADRIFSVRHKEHTGHFNRHCHKHFGFYLTILHITAISKCTLSIVVTELGPIWQVITGNKQYRLSSVVSHFTYPLGVTCYR
jgi:hypothetical protein